MFHRVTRNASDPAASGSFSVVAGGGLTGQAQPDGNVVEIV